VNDPDGLLSFHVAAETLPRGLQLVAGLTGFIDSGSTVEQFSDYFTDTLDGHIVAEFRADDLLDYRARRPTIYFDQDHISGYETPKLAIYLLSDDLNRPFYFMTGFEPDFRWEAFARTVRWFIETFEVEATTWVHAIPMPAPHTRPIGVTVSGNRRDLADSMSVWRPNTQAPANAMHIVEYSLDQANHGVVGFVLLVPHYLGDAEYPSAAVVALQSITAATGLIFPTDRLRDEGRAFEQKIDEQVQSNEELAALVGRLEKTYDEYMQDNSIPSPLTAEDGSIPSADSIAAELEEFLAAQRRRESDHD
jgi:hypothetical protein